MLSLHSSCDSITEQKNSHACSSMTVITRVYSRFWSGEFVKW